ncbi:MAG TPA: hypothetical protein VLV83_07570 [Acidobacteriota bacterium]|nr:hypothetical protein [Acidobacteriota bacterium]
MKITVHIERLVLHGLPLTPADGPRLQAAVEAEIARRLEEDGLTPALRSGGLRASAPSAMIRVNASSPAALVGHQVGQAVYGSIIR